jgi:serine/threonine protein kinase
MGAKFDPRARPTDSVTQLHDPSGKSGERGPDTATAEIEVVDGGAVEAMTIPSEEVPFDDSLPREDILGDESFEARYQPRLKIGEGGMGVVRAAVDRRIGREIAMKTARGKRGSKGDGMSRFLREARVQGQLEHPAIVPVYDLARDPSGNPYFTMKRVRGLTLEHILGRLRLKDPAIERQYSRRKLLTAFGSVCLAVHFAHTRGVLHRDLKPANIMLGDYGEVYVLDWGLAKIRQAAPQESAQSVEVPYDDDVQTIVGEMMGTPGYMAPEQAHGAPNLDARIDVYSLGALLFEIVTHEPLHTRESVDKALRSTVRGAEMRFAVRFPDRELPIELEEVCMRAVSIDPNKRYQSARDLSDAIWAFLDGDRDTERKKSLATQHAASAHAAADRALAGGAGAVEERGRAMAEVSRALALDPTNADAIATVIRLLTEPPRELPPEARAELHASSERTFRVSTRAATIAYLSWAIYVPLVVWMGVKDWRAFGVAAFFWALTVATGLFIWRRRSQPDSGVARWAIVLLSALALAATSTIFGPFMLLPSMAAINATMLTLNYDRSMRIATMVTSCLAVIAPAVLGFAGVLPTAYSFHEGTIIIKPMMLHFNELPTTIVLLVCNVAIILTSCLMTSRVRDTLAKAEQRLQLQAWQLRQLVPTEARAFAANPPTATGAYVRVGR